MERVTLKYYLEKSDHDGYCSGEECEYTCEKKTVSVEIPRAEAERIDSMSRAELAKYHDLIPDSKLDLDHGSGYCDRSEQASKRGLGAHDFKITILRGKRFDH